MFNFIYIYCKESWFAFVRAAACSCGIASMLNSWIVTGVEGTWLVVCSSWSRNAELHRTFPFCFIARFNRNPQRILVILWQAGEPLWVHQWRQWWWWEDRSTAAVSLCLKAFPSVKEIRHFHVYIRMLLRRKSSARPGSIPGQSLWDFWTVKWQGAGFSPNTLGFSCQLLHRTWMFIMYRPRVGHWSH